MLNENIIKTISTTAACAKAFLGGSAKYNSIYGAVHFWRYQGGSIVMAEVSGLPDTMRESPGKTDITKNESSMAHGRCDHPIFALHVHAGFDCSGTPAFADADGHYNPEGCEHPYHAGDLPPLFSCGGRAWLAVYTDRFTPADIIGRTVIIHIGPDDFHTQPSGNSGEMIACGLIQKNSC